MAQLSAILPYIESLLNSQKFKDASLNGVQVGGWDRPIKTVAYAVDSGLSIIEAAVAKQADLLIVHHGLFWDKPQAITGPLREKIELLIKNKCTLFASHLPLDASPEVGNGFELGKFLGLEELSPWGEYNGMIIGARGSNRSQSIETLVEKLTQLPGAIKPLLLNFGPEKIKSVGLMTGSGSFAISQAARDGLDLLVSGEPKQEAYHLAREFKLNIIYGGHYATETVGVAALAKKVAERFSCKVEFLDEPTGI
jgi:dinuclear metal center YbgI/SA1388 family protein